jgi:phage-related protein
MKSIVWVGDSLERVRSFPSEARAQAGHELRLVQQGLEPSDWKPMPGIGLGVREIRIHVGTAHRIFYVAKFPEAVYVLHAVTKQSQKTPKREIEIAATRFRHVTNERKIR